MMKKTLIILLVAVMGIGYAAQSKAEFKFGPRIGLNVNKMSFDSKVLDGENRCGFTGGVQAEYTVPIINLGFDLSLMYSYMDSKVKAEVQGLSAEGSTKAGKHFLEIPLNIKYKIGIPAIANILRPYVFTGPSVAFRLDKNGDDALFDTKTSQWAWNLGIGLEFINHLQISAGYGFGMNNIIDGKKIAGVEINTDNIKAKNNYWTISAAYLF